MQVFIVISCNHVFSVKLFCLDPLMPDPNEQSQMHDAIGRTIDQQQILGETVVSDEAQR